MKRSYEVHFFITLVLGGTIGPLMSIAVSMSSIFYGVLAILASIATVLNIICGDDEKSNSKKDEK